MIRFVLVSVCGGLLFGLLDGLVNANPLAVRLFEVFRPILRTSIPVTAGIAIDLAYGFLLAGFFGLLYASLPGRTGLAKGISYALLVWFFRVGMSAISQWVMYRIPVPTLLYSLAAGLIEMLALGILFGLALRV